eukprot:Opistho-2@34688
MKSPPLATDDRLTASTVSVHARSSRIFRTSIIFFATAFLLTAAAVSLYTSAIVSDRIARATSGSWIPSQEHPMPSSAIRVPAAVSSDHIFKECTLGSPLPPSPVAFDACALERCASAVSTVASLTFLPCHPHYINASLVTIAVEPERDALTVTVLIRLRNNANVGRGAIASVPPFVGALLRGKLSCRTCHNIIDPALSIQVYAYSYDHCDGQYSLSFMGLPREMNNWDLSVMPLYANYAHYVSTGDRCNRTLPGHIKVMPDSLGSLSCKSPRETTMLLAENILLGTNGSGHRNPGSKFSAMPPIMPPAQNISSTRRGLHAYGCTLPVRPTDPLSAKRSSNGWEYKATNHLSLCRTQGLDDGRWVLRSRPSDNRDGHRTSSDGDIERQDPCRQGGTPHAKLLWDHDNYAWCPYNCALRYYDASDVDTCFRRRNWTTAVFFGDSRMRNQFCDLRNRLSRASPGNPNDSDGPQYGCVSNGSVEFSVANAVFKLTTAWGYYPDVDHAPDECQYDEATRNNGTAFYLAKRRSLGRKDGPRLLQSVFENRPRNTSGTGADLVIISEGLHSMQTFITDADFATFVRNMMSVLASVKPQPPQIVYVTMPATADMSTVPTKGEVRMARLNKVAVIVRKMAPSALIFDAFAMTITRALDRYYDRLHFFPDPSRGQKNRRPLSDYVQPHPRIIASELNLALLNLVCNEVLL